MEAKQQPPYPLRISPELRERLEAEAAKAKRSLNAEIADRLERSFGPAVTFFGGQSHLLTFSEDGAVTKADVQEVFAKLAKEAEEVSTLAKVLHSLAGGFTVSIDDEPVLARAKVKANSTRKRTPRG